MSIRKYINEADEPEMTLDHLNKCQAKVDAVLEDEIFDGQDFDMFDGKWGTFAASGKDRVSKRKISLKKAGALAVLFDSATIVATYGLHTKGKVDGFLVEVQLLTKLKNGNSNSVVLCMLFIDYDYDVTSM